MCELSLSRWLSSGGDADVSQTLAASVSQKTTIYSVVCVSFSRY
jgi:hypothetical protein